MREISPRTGTLAIAKILLTSALLLFTAHESAAQCLKFVYNAKTKATSAKFVGLTHGKCRKGTVAQSAITGPQGVDGKYGVFGDGSAGDLTVSSPVDFLSTPRADGNYQFNNCLVTAELIVASGTVLRCKGTATISSEVIVVAAGFGGSFGSLSGNVPINLATQGIGRQRAGNGEISNAGGFRAGGIGGAGIALGEVPFITVANFRAGGGGGGASGSSGGQGGGAVAILAKAGITITGAGSIIAGATDGFDGSGGGAGGILLLATEGTLTQNGTLAAVGGIGGDGETNAAPGGGGGGGIVRIIAQSVVPSLGGTITVSGGAKGTPAVNVTTSPSAGGAGGGGCGGTGGNGASVAVTNIPTSAVAGSSGSVLITQGDAASIL